MDISSMQIQQSPCQCKNSWNVVKVVQVGRMGYVPAQGGNGNSRNVSCSKPSLHRRKRPWEGALYKWLKAPLTLCIWRYINELHLHLQDTLYLFQIKLIIIRVLIFGIVENVNDIIAFTPLNNWITYNVWTILMFMKMILLVALNKWATITIPNLLK